MLTSGGHDGHRHHAGATLRFYAAINDPRVVLSPNVDASKMYYQRLPRYQTTSPVEQQL